MFLLKKLVATMTRGSLRRAACVCICIAAAAAAQDDEDETTLTNLPEETSDIILADLPAGIERSLGPILDGLGTCSNIPMDAMSNMMAFIDTFARSNGGWRLATRWKAEGAGIMSVTTGSFPRQLLLNFSTNVPDYMLFPCSLRYSSPVKEDDYVVAFRSCVAGRPETNARVAASFLCVEETTPNLQSGTSYAYTNLRSIVRANVGGRDIMFSYSDMIGPSSIAVRGLPVGDPARHLYYVSTRQGTNLRFAYMASARMYISRSLVIYQQMGPDEMAVAVFSWVRAGWKGINVTRSASICTVLATVRDMRRQIASASNVTEQAVSRIVTETAALSSSEVSNRFAQYCAYVKAESDKSGNLLSSMCTPGLLRNLYDQKALDALDLPRRRALIMQEHMRVLLGIPTWSVTATNAPQKEPGGWQFWK